MASKKIKIGIVISSLNIGGTEMGILRNIPKLDRDRFEVVVINFHSAGKLAPDLVRQGIPVIVRPGQTDPEPITEGSTDGNGPDHRQIEMRGDALDKKVEGLVKGFRAFKQLPLIKSVGSVFSNLGGRSLKQFLDTLFLAFVLKRWIGKVLNREQVDIVHCYLPDAYIFGMLACLKRPQAKRVMYRGILNQYQNSHKLTGFIERRLHPYLHLAIGNCKAILKDLRREGVQQDKLRLLYNGIDPSPFTRKLESRSLARQELNIPESSFVMVNVANLRTRKGHQDLIEACALAAPDLPESWLLLIAGRDEENKQGAYQERIEELELQDHIRLMGECPDVRPLLWAADLFVFPSHDEGLPNAIMEAMSASLPVIGTRIAGIPEQIVVEPEEDSTGWLVSPHRPSELADAIKQAAEQRSRLEAMGQRGRKRIEANLSLQKSVATYESIYTELMATPV